MNCCTISEQILSFSPPGPTVLYGACIVQIILVSTNFKVKVRLYERQRKLRVQPELVNYISGFYVIAPKVDDSPEYKFP